MNILQLCFLFNECQVQFDKILYDILNCDSPVFFRQPLSESRKRVEYQLCRVKRKRTFEHAQNVPIHFIRHMHKTHRAFTFIDTFYSIQCLCLRTTKALIRIRGCAGWFGLSMSTYAQRYLYACEANCRQESNCAVGNNSAGAHHFLPDCICARRSLRSSCASGQSDHVQPHSLFRVFAGLCR